MVARFVRGFIDGSLSTLGIVIGASAASSVIIIAAALGGTLANGISNVLSALSSEEYERYAELKRIEESMVSRHLRGTVLERRIRREALLAAAYDGAATIAGGAIPIVPYIILPASRAIIVASAVSVLTIFLLGLYLGAVSRRNIILAAVRLAILAAATAGIVYLVQRILVRG